MYNCALKHIHVYLIKEHVRSCLIFHRHTCYIYSFMYECDSFECTHIHPMVIIHLLLQKVLSHYLNSLVMHNCTYLHAREYMMSISGFQVESQSHVIIAYSFINKFNFLRGDTWANGLAHMVVHYLYYIIYVCQCIVVTQSVIIIHDILENMFLTILGCDFHTT